MTRRAVFVSDVGPDVHGAWSNVQFKSGLIEDIGYRVSVVTVEPGGLADRLRRMLGATVAVMRSRLVYARITPSTAPLLALARLFRRPLLVEVNGFVVEDSQLTGRSLAVVGTLLRFALRGPRSRVLSDLAYRDYAIEEWLGADHRDSWTHLPLVAMGDLGEHRAHRALAGPRPEVLYTGFFDRRQGLHDLIAAFGRVAPPQWRLRLVGDGPTRGELVAAAHDDPRISIEETVSQEAAHALMTGAGVLAAPYDFEHGAGHPVSSLKSLSYVMTDRPVLLSRRDTVLESLPTPTEAHGVFVRDASPGSLDAALRGAIAASEAAYPDRHETVIGVHGRANQLAIIEDAIAAVA